MKYNKIKEFSQNQKLPDGTNIFLKPINKMNMDELEATYEQLANTANKRLKRFHDKKESSMATMYLNSQGIKKFNRATKSMNINELKYNLKMVNKFINMQTASLTGKKKYDIVVKNKLDNFAMNQYKSWELMELHQKELVYKLFFDMRKEGLDSGQAFIKAIKKVAKQKMGQSSEQHQKLLKNALLQDEFLFKAENPSLDEDGLNKLIKKYTALGAFDEIGGLE